MKKLFALFLVAVLVPGAILAESENVAESIFDVLADLEKYYDENPVDDRPLTDLGKVNECCLQIYNSIDHDKVLKVFYGGPDEAADVIIHVSDKLHGTDSRNEFSLRNAAYVYVATWCILHYGGASALDRASLKLLMKDVILIDNNSAIADATDVCCDYIDRYEPGLLRESEMYTQSVTLDGGPYREYFSRGSKLFDEKRYLDAIDAYLKCLEYKKNDTNARFEIIEAYIALHNYDEAMNWLEDIVPYLVRDNDKAKWYRRLGFIAIEKIDYELASALYICSLAYEESTSARNELLYISTIAPQTRTFTIEEAKEYMLSYGIVPAE